MERIRNRAGLIAAIALTWHIVAIAAVSTALSCDFGPASAHASMENCPLHQSAPACPLHGEQHGTHDCDCPTIGCAETDSGLIALFGAAGILPATADLPLPIDAGDASMLATSDANLLAPVPLSPPPRT
jgi:hypothetical protein